MSRQLRVGLLFLAAGGSSWAELRPETLSAWNSYLRTVEARTKERVESKRPFLWVDEDPARSGAVRNGKIVVAASGSNGLHVVDHGLVHDWIGGVFIKDSSIEDVLAVLRNYGSYREIFKPAVVASKDLGTRAEYSTFSIQWAQKVLFVTAASEGQYEARFFQCDSTRWYATVYSTHLQEIAGYGSANERKFPPGEGPGFVWSLYGVTRYQRRDGGVYLEVEALALSRDIPFSMRWLVKPTIDALAKRGLTSALKQTSEAVRSRASTARYDASSIHKVQ